MATIAQPGLDWSAEALSARPAQSAAQTSHDGLRDAHGRRILDLRVSVTDRCNYRCVYCRSGQGSEAVSELPLEAYLRMVRIFVSLGIEKIRITGGEPLLRLGLADFVGEVAALRTTAGKPLDIALTTNGHLLARHAASLRQAGLSRVTISMDAMEPGAFARITRVPGSFDRVLEGLRAAQDAGFPSPKVNCVLMRGWNDDQIVPFAHFARDTGVIVRFIEFMPLEEDRVWSRSLVVPAKEVERELATVAPLVRLTPNCASETALRYSFADGRGEIGIIAPVSNPFCGACSRIRLTADGRIRTCLFSQMEHDLYGPLARGASDEDLEAEVLRAVMRKEARHHIGEPGFLQPARTMVHIGG